MTGPPTLVLVEPQDIVNIAGAVRIAKNFAMSNIRLVRPRVYDPYRIEGIAHSTGDIIERIRICDSLDAALSDCVYVVALTARERTAKRQLLRPREAARIATERAHEGTVALVFGREDKGLTNDELDRCHALAGIATNPLHRSLNLAQAIAIMAYECWIAREGADQARKPPRRRASPASAADYELFFHDWSRALWAIDFFKRRNPDHVMRGLRELFFRADPDDRELKLFRAVALEVVHRLEREGARLDLPRGLERPGGAAPSDPAEADGQSE